MSLTPLLRTSENHEMEPSDYSKLMSLRTSDPLLKKKVIDELEIEASCYLLKYQGSSSL